MNIHPFFFMIFTQRFSCIQSDDTDGTTANEDEALHQQPNNTRAPAHGPLGAGSKQSPRDLTLSSKARFDTLKCLKILQTVGIVDPMIQFEMFSCAYLLCVYLYYVLFISSDREKLYEEKLRQQKQELKQLHEERQRLIEIQGKIQDLQLACPDFQVHDSCKYT